MADLTPDLVCGCGASDIPGVTGCSADCMQPAPPPDLDAIRERLEKRLAAALGHFPATRSLLLDAVALQDEVTRLRPMEAALTAAKALHQPARYAKDRPPNCSAGCRNEHGQPATWPCPTRAALDGGAS